jgi:integrase
MPLQAINNEYSKLSIEYQAGVDVKVEEQRRELAKKLELAAIAEAEHKKQMQGSFGQLMALYLQYLKDNKSKHYYMANKAAFSNMTGIDSNIKACDVAKGDILAAINPVMERGSPVMANRLYAYLGAMYNWALDFDDTHHAAKHGVKFFVEYNPVSGVKRPHKKELPTDRHLSESEVVAFLSALDKSGIAPHRANVLRLMLFTGARLEAISCLTWQDIDMDAKLITIRPERSKNGKYWVIPMCDGAYGVLATTPKLHNVWVLPADNQIDPIRLDYFSKAVTRLCAQFDLVRFSPKDLRSTFKTLAGKAGINKDIRDRIQNHAFTDV